jgi:hypothetical protein
LQESTTVPGLYELHKDAKVQLTWTEIQNEGWFREPETSPYYLQIEALYHSSSKLQQIWEIQTTVANEKHGIDRQPEGLVSMPETREL